MRCGGGESRGVWWGRREEGVWWGREKGGGVGVWRRKEGLGVCVGGSVEAERGAGWGGEEGGGCVGGEMGWERSGKGEWGVPGLEQKQKKNLFRCYVFLFLILVSFFFVRWNFSDCNHCSLRFAPAQTMLVMSCQACPPSPSCAVFGSKYCGFATAMRRDQFFFVPHPVIFDDLTLTRFHILNALLHNYTI